MEENKLIAEFMGLRTNSYGDYNIDKDVMGFDMIVCALADTKFHESWDWLMPVVQKIEGLGYWVNRNDGDVTITDESDIIVVTPMSSGGIDMMYKAVVEFIKQYDNV